MCGGLLSGSWRVLPTWEVHLSSSRVNDPWVRWLCFSFCVSLSPLLLSFCLLCPSKSDEPWPWISDVWCWWVLGLFWSLCWGCGLVWWSSSSSCWVCGELSVCGCDWLWSEVSVVDSDEELWLPSSSRPRRRVAASWEKKSHPIAFFWFAEIGRVEWNII